MHYGYSLLDVWCPSMGKYHSYVLDYQSIFVRVIRNDGLNLLIYIEESAGGRTYLF